MHYGLNRKNFMFILSSPSGAGKTTLSKLLLEHDNNIKMSISCTTRPKRMQEIEGVDYFFLKKEEFFKKIAKDHFYEYAEVFNNFYGTPKKNVNQLMNNGYDVLFDIDWQGSQQLKKVHKNNIVSIFILPPSINELKRRLRARAQDKIEVINDRMVRAESEISHLNEYDYIVINDSLDESLKQIINILNSERLKTSRQLNVTEFINNQSN